ncbi:hypothetical protein L0Y69_00950, partial [bacterium]|nr:hypothetical protein [bacterium]
VPALATIEAEFVATVVGDFPFYCSVPCGEGEVAGKTRGHFDQVGKVRVIAAGAASEETPGSESGATTFERAGTWEEVVEALKTGNVTAITQTHDLTVKVTLKNGTVFTAKEPEIDAIFTEIRKCGGKCAGIIQATE